MANNPQQTQTATTTTSSRKAKASTGTTATVASAAHQYKTFTRAKPAEITASDKVYFVAVTCGMWFFQLKGCPDAGWTCSSPEFVQRIEEELRA